MGKTRRTTSACRLSLTSCRASSSPTRSRLRRLRRSPPSTWPSTARWPVLLEMPRLLLMPMNRLALSPHLLDCKTRGCDHHFRPHIDREHIARLTFSVFNQSVMSYFYFQITI